VPSEAGTDEPALTATTMLAQGTTSLTVAPSVVLVFEPSLVPVRRIQRAGRKPHPFRAVGKAAPGVDIVAAQGPGAPVAAITVEFLAALGVRDLILVGTAGALSNDPGVGLDGSVAVVTEARSDEGTSIHYGAHHQPNADLTAALQQNHPQSNVVTMTTDVPFRHTPERLAEHREQADVIEMEAAAVFAAANFFDVRAAALLVCSDVFGTVRPWYALNPQRTAQGLRNGVEAAVATLRSHAGVSSGGKD